ncbi:uncharacterized protein K452DRAFT_239713, partial [Aplosporella prunicola CBS 121167]
ASSELMSITSEIERGYEENGRIYPAYGSHDYGFLIDQDEFERLNCQHLKYFLLLENKLYLSPLRSDIQRILDVGTGTGIWASEMAGKFPSAEVIGTDIAPVQPYWYARSVDDCEQDWHFKKESFDFIYNRDCYLGIRDWPRLVRQAYEHLKPGGWLELACVWPVPKCDDGTMPEDAALVKWCEAFIEISQSMNADAHAPRHFHRYLKEAGFSNTQEKAFKTPTSGWPKDERLKKVGKLEMWNVFHGAETGLLRGFMVAGKSREEMESLAKGIKEQHSTNKMHCYTIFYVVYGQKPENG